MRQEFDRKTKAAAFERAKGRCEKCTARLAPGHTHYDHRVPDALGGKSVLENCDVLCRNCHGLKTAKTDIPNIARAVRRESAHWGFKPRPSRPMPCGRNSPYRKTISGAVVRRETDHD